ncbi:MAG: hypothetical protein ABR973_14160 [Candidatus Acidiferrales bacterium]|jgi:hypothetical protein
MIGTKYGALAVALLVFCCSVAPEISHSDIGLDGSVLAASPATGTYNFSYYSSGPNQWMTVITSTLNAVTDCTITWDGVNTASKHIGGSNGFVLPAYPGFGAAITSRYQYSDLTTFNAQAVCKPRT